MSHLQAMFTVTGRLAHMFTEQVTNKETGEVTPRHRIQLLGDIPLREDAGARLDLATFNVESLEPYRDLEGQVIRLPFGFFSPAKGQVVQFIPKGSKPQAVGA